jgi:hypothetical protein
MTSACERCPIPTKITSCCGSNPDTGKTKFMRSNKTGEVFTVCDKLRVDGLCEIYSKRPDSCKGYVCEKVYAMGLNSQE